MIANVNGVKTGGWMSAGRVTEEPHIRCCEHENQFKGVKRQNFVSQKPNGTNEMGWFALRNSFFIFF